MANKLRQIAKEVLKNYNPKDTYSADRDSEGAVTLTPQLSRAFPIFSLNCLYGDHQAHLNPWANGDSEHLKVYNAQEANALRPLYALHGAKMILGGLEKFSNGTSEEFLVDTPDNGFVTIYSSNFGSVAETRDKLAQGAKDQSQSKIKCLTKIAEDAREGFYWQNIPQEIVDSGNSFTQSRKDWVKQRTSIYGMDKFLAENPEAFRNYFKNLIDFTTTNSNFLKNIQTKTLDRFPLLVLAEKENRLVPEEYIQGQFFVPEQGWRMLDGEFAGMTSIKVDGEERQAIQLNNYSDHADEFRKDSIVVVSNIEEFGNPIWRLGK